MPEHHQHVSHRQAPQSPTVYDQGGQAITLTQGTSIFVGHANQHRHSEGILNHTIYNIGLPIRDW